MVGVAPTTEAVSSSISEEQNRKLKVKMSQRFIFLMLENIIHNSCTGTVINDILLLPRVATVIADWLEERALLCLKRRISFIDCSLCTTPSRTRHEDNQVCSHDSSSEEVVSKTRPSPKSVRNTKVQPTSVQFSSCDVSVKVGQQVSKGTHGKKPFLKISGVGLSRKKARS